MTTMEEVHDLARMRRDLEKIRELSRIWPSLLSALASKHLDLTHPYVSELYSRFKLIGSIQSEILDGRTPLFPIS